jgi:tRNA G18 (ribose-2'-O)-methylase SpoU
MPDPSRVHPFAAADPSLDVFLRLTDVQARTVREPAEGVYIAEGLKVVRRALVAGHRPLVALATARWVPDLEATLPADVPIHQGTEDELKAVTGYRVHRGGLVCFARPDDPGLEPITSGARRLVVLENLKEHTNVGAIVRSARALGIEGAVLSPDCADPLYRRAVKVSMGTVFDLPWTRAAHWPSALGALTEAGFVLAALTPRADARDLAELASDPPQRLAWVLGTEGTGLEPATLTRCPVSVRIPMTPGVDSLNVAAAAAIAFHATSIVPARTASGAGAPPTVGA